MMTWWRSGSETVSQLEGSENESKLWCEQVTAFSKPLTLNGYSSLSREWVAVFNNCEGKSRYWRIDRPPNCRFALCIPSAGSGLVQRWAPDQGRSAWGPWEQVPLNFDWEERDRLCPPNNQGFVPSIIHHSLWPIVRLFIWWHYSQI